MGAWGTKLYDNDLTCDIRDTYIDMLENSEDYNLAYTQILAEYADDCTDECEKAMLTYVLADVQHDYGCVIQSVLENAMNYIAVGGVRRFSKLRNRLKNGLKLWIGSRKSSAVNLRKERENHAAKGLTLHGTSAIVLPIQCIQNPRAKAGCTGK